MTWDEVNARLVKEHDELRAQRDDYKAHFEACERARATLLAERDELREALRACHRPKLCDLEGCKGCDILERLSRHPVLPGKGTPGG